MRLSLQHCGTEQLESLVRLSKATFQDAFAHLNNPGDFENYLNSAFSERAISEELKNPASSFYFVHYQTELAGYFKLNRAEAQTDIHDLDSLEIERIYVHKDFQGRKIGQWMMDQIKEIALKEDKKYLWLGVWEVNKSAIRFYQANGFKKFGEHPYYIGKDRQTDWLMRCDITTLRL